MKTTITAAIVSLLMLVYAPTLFALLGALFLIVWMHGMKDRKESRTYHNGPNRY